MSIVNQRQNRYTVVKIGKAVERMEEMNSVETMKICVEEFSRLQDWMQGIPDKDSGVYQSMKTRYRDLKVILSGMGVNVTELDALRE